VAVLRNRAVFLDRDGVLNEERGDYTWRPNDFRVLPDVPGALRRLKAEGYHLIVVTNQAGVAKGLYGMDDVRACHEKLQATCGGLIDAFYVAPGHPSVSESLSRKPGSLLLEKAMARFGLDPAQSWMVGDRGRDIAAGHRAGVRTIRVGKPDPQDGPAADYYAGSLEEAARLIVAAGTSGKSASRPGADRDGWTA